MASPHRILKFSSVFKIVVTFLTFSFIPMQPVFNFFHPGQKSLSPIFKFIQFSSLFHGALILLHHLCTIIETEYYSTQVIRLDGRPDVFCNPGLAPWY